MIRTFLIVVALAGLFPSYAYQIVDVARGVVTAVAGAVGGREQLVLIVAAVVVVVQVSKR